MFADFAWVHKIILVQVPPAVLEADPRKSQQPVHPILRGPKNFLGIFGFVPTQFCLGHQHAWIAVPYHRLGWEIIHQRLPALGQQFSLQIGQDHCLVHFPYRQLGFRVKGPEALRPIAVQFHAVRPIAGIAVHIHNAASNRVLPRLVHKIHPLKPHLAHQFNQEIQINGLVLLQFQGVTSQGGVEDHLLHQGIRPGDQPGRRIAFRTVSGGQPAQYFGALKDLVLVLRFRAHLTTVGAGKHQQMPGIDHGFQIGIGIGCGLFVGQNHHLQAFQPCKTGCGHDRIRPRAGQAFQVHPWALCRRLILGVQAFHSLQNKPCSGIFLQNLVHVQNLRIPHGPRK